jgi:hypothetical protein
MRDENGTYIGNHHCGHLIGVEKIEERTCCGGRKSKFASVRCVVNGIVLAEGKCMSQCKDSILKGRLI